MIDAEIQEGDLAQITTAIHNALKPTVVIQQRGVTPALPINSGARETSIDQGDAEDLLEEEADAVVPPIPPKASARERRVRKPSTPRVLDIDLVSGVSFESFASAYDPKSDVDRNLIVLAYFKEHMPSEEVTVHHVYTCYRRMKWPAGIEDFSWPLRRLKKDQLVSNPSRGVYAINHLGMARVDGMAA